MRLVLVLFVTVQAQVNFSQCSVDAADEVINQLHDDLDDDDDGTISNTENRAFISEYGGAASSIGALLDDNDGKVSKREFLQAWRVSAVHNWTVEDVGSWVKSPDLNLPTELGEKLAEKFAQHKIDGNCFPLLARLEQDFLKSIGIKQHLIRRKIALRSMDAILFGPPAYDNAVKDFVLAILAVFVIFSVTFIIRLKRQFRDVQSRLMSEQTRLADLDSMWKEFAGDTPSGDTDSGSTILDLPADGSKVSNGDKELSQLNSYKRENEQLRRSLEEAHRELRTMQEGGSVEHVQINAELRSLLQRTFRIEKEQLDGRRAEARKREKMARENMRKIQRANDSFFSSVRLIHSQQLDQIDSAIHHAQQAIEEVMIWQKDCHARWRKLETIFKVQFILRQKESPTTTKSDPLDVGDGFSSQKMPKQTRVGILQHQHSIETQMTDTSSKQSTISADSCLPKSQVSLSDSPKAEVNSNVSHQLEQSYAQLEPSSSSSVLQESSIESGSVTSSASHIKVKKTRFPKFFDRKKFVNLSFRKKGKSKD